MERKLIDANAFASYLGLGDTKEERERSREENAGEIVTLEDFDRQPVVNAVKVIRCKDCKFWGDEDGPVRNKDGLWFARCRVHNYVINGTHIGWCPKEDDFCSVAERKDGVEHG